MDVTRELSGRHSCNLTNNSIRQLRARVQIPTTAFGSKEIDLVHKSKSLRGREWHFKRLL